MKPSRPPAGRDPEANGNCFPEIRKPSRLRRDLRGGLPRCPTSTGAAQGLSKNLLLLGGQLPAIGGHVEDVDGFVGLSVDQDHLDVPTVGGNRGCQIVERSEERRVGKECRSRWS